MKKHQRTFFKDLFHVSSAFKEEEDIKKISRDGFINLKIHKDLKFLRKDNSDEKELTDLGICGLPAI